MIDKAFKSCANVINKFNNKRSDSKEFFKSFQLRVLNQYMNNILSQSIKFVMMESFSVSEDKFSECVNIQNNTVSGFIFIMKLRSRYKLDLLKINLTENNKIFAYPFIWNCAIRKSKILCDEWNYKDAKILINYANEFIPILEHYKTTYQIQQK